MKKSILNLGAQELSKNEQKSVNGGLTRACANARANGCVTTINATNCFSLEGVYNTSCKCCNL